MLVTLPVFRGWQENLRLIILSASFSAFLTGQASSQQRGFSVKDDIAMARFNDPSAGTNTTEQFSDKYSPDGKHVAIVTTRGLLASDRAESSVTVFDLEEVKNFLRMPSQRTPRARVVATITAVPHDVPISFAPIIKDVHWSEDSRHIYFRGENVRGGFQLYEANANGTGFHSLTPASYNVDRFDLAADTIAYTAARMDTPPTARGTRINRDALDITGYWLNDILFAGQRISFEPETFSMFTLRVGKQHGIPRQVPGYSVRDLSLYLYLLPFRLSPDGTQLVSTEPVAGRIPASWERYDPAPLFEHRRWRSDDPDITKIENVLRPRRYTLINLTTGKATPLVNAPNAQILGYFADANRIAWSDDGKRVLVTNLFYPADPDRGVNASPPTKPCVVASIDLPSLHRGCFYFDGATTPLSSTHVVGVRFGNDRNEALVYVKSNTQQPSVIAFHLQSGLWKKIPSVSITWSDEPSGEAILEGAPGRSDVRVYVRQDLNEAPTLWASNLRTHRAHLIWNPNPELQDLDFGQASVYHWKDEAGRDWTGGLVKPVGYVPGRRYPLVIQMYNFREHQFLTDGTDPSAFAARQLASAGFVVLQIQKQSTVLSDVDAQISLAGYESAIRRLSDDGLVDRERVGVVGFSWTCWYAVNAIIKVPHLFAAATIADGLDNSYMQYLLFSPGDSSLPEQFEAIRGGKPFGAGLDRWIRDAPGFHLDQVETPVRIEAINPTSVLQEWELYSSLYMQHKPVDMIYFPNGTHIHQEPLERLESQQGNVDWMRFWLQGYEDPDPAKRKQYERWHKLRNDEPLAHP
jgi:dipeptidyl aminopeptidase/acylaminoacyl peptidase